MSDANIVGANVDTLEGCMGMEYRDVRLPFVDIRLNSHDYSASHLQYIENSLEWQ